jgi:hypothetical protein
MSGDEMVDIVNVLIEMTTTADCRLIGSWLVAAAEAQTLWSQALSDPDFEDWVVALCDWTNPDLECFALEILAALQQRDHVVAADPGWTDEIGGVFGIEFAMMVHLGFFTRAGQSYGLTLPEFVTLERIQQAALHVRSTVKDYGHGPVPEPHLLLHTVPEAEAEAWRSWIVQMRRLDSEVQVAGGVRLSLSNARVRMTDASAAGRKSQLARRHWVLFAREV